MTLKFKSLVSELSLVQSQQKIKTEELKELNNSLNLIKENIQNNRPPLKDSELKFLIFIQKEKKF